jgi:hypothetical protein
VEPYALITLPRPIGLLNLLRQDAINKHSPWGT